MAKKTKKQQPNKTQFAPKLRFKYICPSCTKVAIKTSNKMVGVNITCENCKKQFAILSEDNYIKL